MSGVIWDIAHQKGFLSIAFRLIGAGAGGFNQERARAIMEGELRKLEHQMEVRLVVIWMGVVAMAAVALAR